MGRTTAAFRRSKQLITAAITAIVVLTTGACARVKPYARETHARRAMQDRPAVDKKLDNHVHEYREGAVGGSGVGGGGCGCN